MSGKKLLFQIIKHFHGALSNGYYLRKLLPFVLMAMLLPCQSAVALRKRPPQEDACPNTLRGPGNDLVLPYITHNGIERQCCACNPGYRLEKLCEEGNFTSTVCVPCEPNTYITDFAHGRATCDIDDLVCPRGLIKIPSEPDTDPRCDCPKGYFKTDYGECVNHTPCPPGHGVKVHGSPFRDTECEECLSGYESPYESTTHMCTLKKSISVLYENTTSNATIEQHELTTTVKATSAMPVIQEENHKKPEQGPNVWLIVPIVVVFSTITVAGVAFFFWRYYQKKNDVFCPFRKDPEPCSDSKEPLNKQSGDKKSRRLGKSNDESDGDDTMTDERKVTSDKQPRKTTSSPYSPTRLQRSSRADSLCRSSSSQTLNSYHTIMNNLKLNLQENMDEEIRNRMLRVLTRNKLTTNQQETYLSNLNSERRFENEKFCAIFAKLQELLGEEKFNPSTLHKFFLDEVKNLSVAEIIQPYASAYSSSREAC